MNYISILLTLTFQTIQSCQSLPRQNDIDQIIGLWAGEYEHYQYFFEVYPDLQYRLDLIELNSTSVKGKLTLINDSVKLVFDGEDFF